MTGKWSLKMDNPLLLICGITFSMLAALALTVWLAARAALRGWRDPVQRWLADNVSYRDPGGPLRMVTDFAGGFAFWYVVICAAIAVVGGVAVLVLVM